MRNRIVQYAFIIAIVAFIVIICIFGLQRSNINIGRSGSSAPDFVSSEKEYIEQNDEIRIYVDENLRYLMGNGTKGFLPEVLDNVLDATGFDVKFTEDAGEADCRLMIVSNGFRNGNNDVRYTSPLFQDVGALFVSSDEKETGSMTGVAMKDRINDRSMERLKYDGKNIDFIEETSAEDAVDRAVEEDLGFIMGDMSAVSYALNGDDRYVPDEEEIYSLNVCLVTNASQEALYGIINKCVHNADMYSITYQAGEKWMNGSGPLYERNSYSNLYIIVLIILVSGLIVFFIYYNTNKNLYDELNDRMKQLTESKEELKTTFNGVGYCLAELTLEGDILDINRAFFDFFRGEGINRKIWEVIENDPDSRKALEQKVMNTGQGKRTNNIEISMNKQIMEVEVFPIENARGVIEKLLFMAEDVTDKRSAERQMIQDNKMIAVGQLAAGVAHEIRNPLGIIRNYCYVLKNTDDMEMRQTAVEHIEKGVKDSGTIIDSLLNFSRVSENESNYIDIEEHIRELITLNKSVLQEKNIKPEIICSEQIKTYIVSESLDMVMLNLISNAIDAMDDDGNLTIKVVKYEEQFEISVQDTGTGIDEDTLLEIFNPFFTTKGNNEGNGLGLYIVYNEIDKLNGKIEVDSKKGEGSEFRVTLPLIDDPGTEEEDG